MLALMVLLSFAGLLVLARWAAARLSRAQVLRTLALFLRRQMPLEASLAGLAAARAGGKEEQLMRRIATELRSGADLPGALSGAQVVTAQQAVALTVAREHGRIEALLARLADEATRMEKRLAATEVSIIYPLAVGLGIWINTAFLLVFIVPKFQQIFSELGFIAPHDASHYMPALTLSWCLVGWGLLAWALQIRALGEQFWWHVPWLGAHFRLSEQAALARNLGAMLGGGATLERAIGEIADAGAGGPLQARLIFIRAELTRGDAPAAAFRAAGDWRPEFLWAIESVSHGAPPELCLEEVAVLLEDKAKAHLDRIHRIFAPAAFMASAAGVALLGTSVFGMIYSIARQMMG